MPHVIWTARALSDLDRLFHHLAQHSRTSALRALLTIDETVNLLSQHPLSGRASPDRPGRREWLVPFGRSAYRVLYRLDDDNILIETIYHGRERIPTEPDAP